MDKTELEWALGYAVVTSPDGVPDELIQQAKYLAWRAKEDWLFGHVQSQNMELEGWKLDVQRRVWTAPSRDEIPPELPVRRAILGLDPRAVDRRGGSPGGDHGSRSSAPPPREDPTRLTDRRLAGGIEATKVWQRWVADPEAWQRRWARRALWIGRAASGAWVIRVDSGGLISLGPPARAG